MRRRARRIAVIFVGAACATLGCRQVLQIDDGELFDGSTLDGTADTAAPDAPADAPSDGQEGDASKDSSVVDVGGDILDGCGCVSPPECYQLPATCNDGACTYQARNAGAPCDGGLCNGGGACEKSSGG